MEKDELSLVFRKLYRAARNQDKVKFSKYYYVDEEFSEGMSTPNWQVIYGRRGAGKTTTLEAFENKIGNHYDTKAIAVLIDISSMNTADIGISPSKENQITAASNYFDNFISQLCKKIFLDYVDESKEWHFKKFFIGKNKSDRGNVETLILEIEEIASGNNFVAKPKSVVVTKKSSDKSDSKFEGSLGFEKALPTASFSAEFNENDYKDVEEVYSYEFEEGEKYNILFKKINQLRDTLNLDNIYILIDEWTHLDKSGKLEIQPYFAEYLKRMFSKIVGMSIKISAIKGTTVLFRKDSFKQIGLEIEDDIYVCVDLDELHSRSSGNAFFEKLIFNKMLECDKRVVKYAKKKVEGDKSTEPLNGFIQSFFDPPELFDELVEASGRIPRAFYDLFAEVSATFDHDVTKKWTRLRMIEKIVTRSVAKRNDVLQHAQVGKFLKKITEVISETKGRIFLLPHGEMIILAEVVSDLFHLKIIHNIHEDDIPIDVALRYRAFYVDYGTYIEITGNYKNEAHFHKVVKNEKNYLNKNYENCIITSADVDLNVGFCPNCNRVISLSHPTVINLKGCYLCSMPFNCEISDLVKKN